MSAPAPPAASAATQAALAVAVLLALLTLTGQNRPHAPAPAAPAWRVDVNTAGGAELQLLPGIGPALAARIVDHRARRPFRRPEDLIEVSGIGPVTLARLRDQITCAPPGPDDDD